jgi:hypothetical protein
MAKKRKVRDKAYRPNASRGTLKLRFTPWRADAVASPLIGIIDQLEHQGTIDVAGGEPVFKALRSGKWCDSVSGIEGVVEMYEIHQVRAGVDLNLEPLRLLANKLKYSMPIFQPDTAAARACVERIRQATLDMTSDYAVDLLNDFRLKLHLDDVMKGTAA